MDDGTEQPSALDPGWYGDPFGRHEQRFHDGTRWTERVRDAAQDGIDPPGIVAAPRTPLSTPSGPAKPIDDAVMPIRREGIAVSMSLALGSIVFLALVAVLVVALVTT